MKLTLHIWRQSSRTDAGKLVDQTVAGGPAGSQRRVEIGHAVADMVDAGPSFREEFRDRSLGGEGRQQLYVRLTEGQRHDGRAVGGLGGMWLETENVPIEGERRADVRHGDPDMSDAGEFRHAAPPSEMSEVV